MMSSFLEWYDYYIYQKSDPRTKDWFLASGLGPLAIIVVLYLYFCIWAGPQYMKNKQPYTLRSTLVVYNLTQVLFNIYLFYEGLMSGWLYEYSLTCQPTDYSQTPMAMRMARAVHLYYLSKIIDLLDTVFFVMRKKQRQISFLHLFHHASMPFWTWIGVRYFAGGHLTFMGLLNTFVHIIMYSYYMLAAFGPNVQKYLWWKKYITHLQMIQFVIVGLHSLQIFFRECDVSKIFCASIVLNSTIFLFLFGNFYFQNFKSETKSIKIGNTSNNGQITSKLD